MTEYILEWFEILTYHKNRIVIYGVGKWAYHSDNWTGMNTHHGRIGPVHNSVEEAYLWLAEEVKAKRINEGDYLKGHHAGEFQCPKGCDDRTLLSNLYFTDIKRARKSIPRNVRKAAKEHMERIRMSPLEIFTSKEVT